MTRSSLALVVVTLTFALLTAACSTSGTPQDGRYQTGGGGWDNFRAAAPQASVVLAS